MIIIAVEMVAVALAVAYPDFVPAAAALSLI